MRTFTGPTEAIQRGAQQHDDGIIIAFEAERPHQVGSPLAAAQHLTQAWAGRSGRLYQAAVVDLITCKAPARAAYVLARRDAAGRAHALFAGLALSAAPTVNLARIRQRAARLGAGEVHLIDLTHSAGTLAGRRLVRDVRAELAGER